MFIDYEIFLTPAENLRSIIDQSADTPILVMSLFRVITKGSPFYGYILIEE